MSFVIPPFHHAEVIHQSINALDMVELQVELGWHFT